MTTVVALGRGGQFGGELETPWHRSQTSLHTNPTSHRRPPRPMSFDARSDANGVLAAMLSTKKLPRKKDGSG